MPFVNNLALWGLWAILPVILLYVYAASQRRKALNRFAELKLLPQITVNAKPRIRWLKMILFTLAVLLLIIAAARPQWGAKAKEVRRTGRDVVFVLDVSRSMQAEDLAPNRLGAAKRAINDCVARIEGDRVGLVVFAGKAVVKCPLTLDYGFFRMMLENASSESVGRGGTMIGDALRTALDDVFDNQSKEFKDIILITDGEDHESFPVNAAEAAGKRGIRLIAIGIGDEHQGTRIPITNEDGRKEFLKYKGQEVWTKLDADTLRKMVNATPGGRYLNVATGTLDLGEIYLDLIAQAEKKELESKTFKQAEERFQIFIAAAFILLAIEMILSERRRARA